MKISDSVIEEIRNSINIVDFISNHVELKQAGNNFKGLCPFHSEKTPSFSVSPEKGLYHCFGCGASGNIFTFIMQFHNLDFIEAVKFLAEKLGISIEEDQNFKNKKAFEEINNYILSTAVSCYNSDSGKIAKNYMDSRKFDEEICSEFSIGYLPDYLTYKKLSSAFSNEILKESGLFYFGKNKMYSRFSGRLIIPICNIYDKIVGFSGRILTGEGAKYINSPETPLFKKREILYNLNKAKEFIKSDNNIIIVEGYFDVMRLHSVGIKNVVSPMGTSLTKEQALILKRYADETTLIFDGDEAGKKAAYRALDVFIDINYYPSVVFLEKGEDPDSIILKKGTDYLKNLIANRKDLLIDVAEKSSYSSKNYNIKMKRLSQIKEKLVKINDPYRKEYYVKNISKIFDVNDEILNIEINTINNDKINIQTTKQSIPYEEEFISALFDLDDDVLDSLITDIQADFFRNEVNKKIFKKVIEIILNNGNIHTLLNDLEIGKSLSDIRVKDFGTEDSYKRALKSKNKILYNHLNNIVKLKKQELSENINDKQKTEILLKEIQDTIEQQLQIKARLLEV
jgi:DNA primase